MEGRIRENFWKEKLLELRLQEQESVSQWRKMKKLLPGKVYGRCKILQRDEGTNLEDFHYFSVTEISA